jgi:phenylacetate-CoA ligase
MTQLHPTQPGIGQWQSWEELAAIQDEKLPGLLARATRSPFYRRRFGGGPIPDSRAGFERLGLTTKQDLRDGYPFELLAVPNRDVAQYHESSGTAGTPTPSFYTERDWVDVVERYSRKWPGISPEDVFLVRTPYALMMTGHMAHSAARACGATVVPGDNRSAAMPYSRVVRVLHDLGVTLTWSMATETLLWAAAARSAGLDPGRDFPNLRALFVGGEPMTSARRRRISEVWGVPVVEDYGSTETGGLAGDCRAGRLHLWADRAIFEVYDPQAGAIRADGAGQLVVTPLNREAMPLIRYNLEDEVEVSYGECECGWRLPTVRVRGRFGRGHCVSGVTIAQHQLESLVFQLPVEDQVVFWRARALPDQLEVEIEVPDGRREGACGALVAAIRSQLGVSAVVGGVSPGTLVPQHVLTGAHDVVKPRSLFGPDEDWSKAHLYY